MPSINFKVQLILSQLDKFYNTVGLIGKYSVHSVGKMFMYDAIYDFLKEEGTIPDYPPDVKQELWTLAQQSLIANKDNKDNINKYYKSFLAVKYLVDGLPERLFLYDEQGNKITRLELTIK